MKYPQLQQNSIKNEFRWRPGRTPGPREAARPLETLDPLVQCRAQV
jgi:hypothetical protein